MPATVMPRVSVPVRISAPAVRVSPPATPKGTNPHGYGELANKPSTTTFVAGMVAGAAVTSVLNTHASAEEIKVTKEAPLAPGQTVDLTKSTTLPDTDLPEVDGKPNHIETIGTLAIFMLLICVVSWFVMPKRMRNRRNMFGFAAVGIITTLAIWKFAA